MINESLSETKAMNNNQETQIKSDYELNKAKYSIAMFLCGLINNSGYVMVGTAAQSIADKFGMDNFMSAFNLSLIMFSIFMVAVNAKLLIKINHRTRLIVILILSALSYVIIGLCTTQNQKWAFFVTLVGSTLCGCMQSLGEACMLGYNKAFPSQLIGFWGSGTGFAGPFASGLFILLTAAKIQDLYVFFFFIFLVLIPLQLVYFSMFSFLDKKRLLLKEEGNQMNQYQEQLQEEHNKKLTCKTISLAYKVAGFFIVNLMLVYFFEYSCTTCWADRATKKYKNSSNFFEKNSFAILSFCYQIGVFISRSSLQIVQIKKVWIMTAIQLINTGCWIYIALYGASVSIQIPLMLWVGLMGGASYVNVMYMILSSGKVEFQYKELVMNVSLMNNNAGIIMAALLAMAVDNFWLK